MQLNDRGSDYEYICGGAIIDEETIVTGKQKTSKQS